MAIYNAGYLSPIRKKLGNAVGRKWRTLDVLAVYQPFVSNPNTDAQKEVRLRFSTLATMAMKLGAQLSVGFSALCNGTKVPQRSMFIRKNWANVIADSPTSVTVDFTEVKISDGSLNSPISSGNADFSEPLRVSVALTAETTVHSEFADKDDKIYLVVYDTVNGNVYEGNAVRADASVACVVPATANGHRVHVYLFAEGKGTLDMGRISPTTYCGSGVIS